MDIKYIKDKMKRAFHLLIKDLWQIRLAILLLVLYSLVTQYFFHAFCPVKIVTGYPCPACGLTRAVRVLIYEMDLGKAWYYNPTVYLWLPFIGLWLIWQYLLEKKLPYQDIWLILMAMAALICYCIRFHELVISGIV